MTTVNAKTVRLAPGRHRSPRDGVCALELTSMLAGERFSDTPHCACPLLAAFARAYNDALDDRRRQELTALAAILVGSRTDDHAWRARRGAELLAYAASLRPLSGRPARWRACSLTAQLARAGARAGQAARRDPAVQRRTLALLTELAGPGAGRGGPGGREHHGAAAPSTDGAAAADEWIVRGLAGLRRAP